VREREIELYLRLTGLFHLFLLLALLLQHLLHNLLLLDEEGADDPVLDTATASRSAVGTVDALLGLGNLGILAGSESRDLLTTISTRNAHSSPTRKMRAGCSFQGEGAREN